MAEKSTSAAKQELVSATQVSEITELCKACHGTKNAGNGGYCDVCQDWGTVRPAVNAAFLAGKYTRDV